MGIRTYLRDHPVLVTSVPLALITLLALGLRLYRLDGQSLWYDEGFSVYLARMDPAEITARTAADIQPPLYYYLLHGWIQAFGDSERALRGLSLLFGVLTVPLICAVAWQLFRNRLAALLAAILVAVSPLHIWYGQEARMYTLLTFLCLLSSYLLLLVIQSVAQGEKRWQTVALWAAYTLSNIAALYTHYFACFVLLFQAFYLLLVWWERGLRPARLILGGLTSGLITILAYLVWLPYLFDRYGRDVSYWLGQLKLSEVLLDIAISFVGGESVLESVGTLLALGYGMVFVLSCAALVMEAVRFTTPAPPGSPSPVCKSAMRASDQYPLAFLLLYLCVPPVLIVILSYNLPKFNARYAMVAHPALLFIVAGGLAALWRGLPEALPGQSERLRPLLRGLAVLALAFVLGASAYANNNAYTNPAFSRADFRGAARYIRRHIAPDETIILSSGHMFPVFDYYAPGVERHLLPDSPTLDTTRTLDYAIASDLNEWLAGRGGVWLLLWQDQVVDPVGYLTTMLAACRPMLRSQASLQSIIRPISTLGTGCTCWAIHRPAGIVLPCSGKRCNPWMRTTGCPSL
jgi:mannosyltransferase